jgi:hypothetical protein
VREPATGSTNHAASSTLQWHRWDHLWHRKGGSSYGSLPVWSDELFVVLAASGASPLAALECLWVFGRRHRMSNSLGRLVPKVVPAALVCSHDCPHCGFHNLLPELNEVLIYTCKHCERAVSVEQTLQ